MGIEKLQGQFQIAVHWIAYPLHPETPPEGLPLREIFAARVDDLPQMAARLQHIATGLGLPLAERSMTYNSRLAQELGKWAEEKGQGNDYHKAVFHAYFAEGKNIAKPAVLASIVRALGLPDKEAREVLKKRTYLDRVNEDWELARELSITSVPTFVLAREAIVGAQSYEGLEKFLLEKGVKRRPRKPAAPAQAKPTAPGKGRKTTPVAAKKPAPVKPKRAAKAKPGPARPAGSKKTAPPRARRTGKPKAAR